MRTLLHIPVYAAAPFRTMAIHTKPVSYYHLQRDKWDSLCHGGLQFLKKTLPEKHFHKYFRFTYDQLIIILPKLGVPLETSDCRLPDCKDQVPLLVGFLIMLSRLSSPRALRPDMEDRWGIDRTILSRVINASLRWTFIKWHHTLAFKPNPFLPNIQQYAHAIGQKMETAYPDTCMCFGFVDGTFR